MELSLENNYFITPYNEIDKPLLTILLIYRHMRDEQILYNFFDSFIKVMNNEDLRKVEFLIKVDMDDLFSISEFCLNKFLQKRYPKLIIRLFAFRRWEGKPVLNYQYWYLFTQRNISSTYMTWVVDDCEFFKNIIPDLIKEKDKYVIYLSNTHTKERLELMKDYRNNPARMVSPFAIISNKIIEIIGNMGISMSTDGWISLINIILYTKYKINIVKQNACVQLVNTRNYKNNYNYQKTLFNVDFVYSGTAIPENKYYFNLVEQQARNIYLNMLADKII